MTKSKFVFIAIIVLLITAFSACKGEFPGYKKNENGLYYKFHLKNNCDYHPQPGDMVSFKMKVYSGDTLFSDDFIEYDRQRMDTSRYKGDLYEALGMMCQGDSATFILSADSLILYFNFSFGDDEIKHIYTDIVMLEIFTIEMLAKEEDSLRQAGKDAFELYKSQHIEEYNELLPGVLFNKVAEGKGKFITDDDIISINLIGTTLSGDTFVDFRNPPYDFRIGDDHGIPFNWGSALRDLKEGGRGSIILTSENAFGSTGFGKGKVKPFEAIKLDVEVIKVSESMKEFESYTIKQFVQRNNITQKPTSEGLYLVSEKEGTGPKLKSGDKVSVHYTGFYLDMGVFDSSRQHGQPMEVIIDSTDVIEGWHKALKMMKAGGKARVIIPSALGYGEDGMPPVIYPYSPLVFDIEVIEKF